MSSSRSSGAPASALTPTSEHTSASASSSAKNESLRRGYRSRRCPRWRLRVDHVEGARGGRPETLLYDADGGDPFQKVTETRDGIVVWMRASPDPSCAVKEVLAEAVFPGVTRDAFWRRRRRRREIRGVRPVRQRISRRPSRRAHRRRVGVQHRQTPVASARRLHHPSLVATCRERRRAAQIRGRRIRARGTRPRKGAIRLAQNRGSWELRETREGFVALRYRVLTDPGAALPAWIVDAANNVRAGRPQSLRVASGERRVPRPRGTTEMGNTGRGGEIGRVAGDVRTREEGGGDDGARRVARELDRRVERVTGEKSRVATRARASVPRNGREERARLFHETVVKSARVCSYRFYSPKVRVRLVHAVPRPTPRSIPPAKALSRVSCELGATSGVPQLSSTHRLAQPASLEI